MRTAFKPFFVVLLMGLFFGTAGEGLLYVEAQCRRVAAFLAEDFRVIVFLGPSAASQQKSLEGALREIPGLDSLRFISSDEALEEMRRQDPELSRSVALLGENPLNAAFEARIKPERAGRAAGWAEAAAKLPGVVDVRYKPLQAGAVAQMQLYVWFLRWILGFSGLLWFSALSFSLWVRRGLLDPVIDLARYCAAAGGAALVGMLLVLGMVLPLSGWGPRIWPPVWAQLLLVLAGAGCGLLPWNAPDRPAPSSLPVEEARELEALTAEALS